MTALLDTRRALEEQVTALGERVETSRREISDSVTSQVSDLHADNRETRTRVNSASTALSEINRSLPGLRQEITDISRAVQDLRAAVNGIVALLADNASAALPGAGGAPHNGTASSEHPDPVAQADAAVTGGPQGPEAAASESVPAAEGADTPAEPVPDSTPVPEPDLDAAGEAELGHEEAAQREAAVDAATTSPPDTAEGEDSDGTVPPQRVRGSELAGHDLVLKSAATVGTVHLVCHRDLWDFIHERAAEIHHFRAPAAPAEEGQDRLRITLSGRSIIGVLIAMRDTWLKNTAYGKDDGTWTLAHAVYERLAHDLATTSRDGTLPLTVVFDDGIGTGPDAQ